MNSDSEEEEELPYEIAEAATLGDFERVKAWLAGGTASAPRSINAGDDTGWTLLIWTARGESRHGRSVQWGCGHLWGVRTLGGTTCPMPGESAGSSCQETQN